MRPFERALRDNPAPRSLGDIQLRSDPPVLVGETQGSPERPRWLPELLLAVGLAAGIGAVAVLISNRAAPVQVAGMLALASALGVAASGQAERFTRRRRRFVLHFGNETLRVDLPGGWRRPTRSQTVHFDAVQEVYVLTKPGGPHALAVDFDAGPSRGPRSAVLVDGVGEDELEELQRLWSTLRAAFGLTRPAPPGG